MISNIKYNLKYGPRFTILLIAVNVLIFIVMIFGGKWAILSDWALIIPQTAQQGEWYRVFTAFWLHFDFEHIVSNMFMLGVLGSRMEIDTGRKGFLICYLLSGLGGNLFSLFLHRIAGETVIAVGASGAIYGLIGLLLAEVLFKGSPINGIGIGRIIIMIVFMIYSSVINESIDFAAHAGGLFSGFIAGTVIVKLSRARINDI